MPYLLEMKNITKNFGSVKAIDNVSLRLNAGEIVSLCGENCLLYTSVGGFTQRAVAPDQVVNAVYALNVHCQTFQTVGDLAGNRLTLQTLSLIHI